MQPKLSARLALDPQSSHVLRRFVVVLGFMVLWAVAIEPQQPIRGLLLMSAVAAAMDGLLAALRRDAFNGAVLTYWDSTCAFFAINCLMRCIA